MQNRTRKNVGVIGLGIIGQRVAECLRRRGFHPFVWNRTPGPFPNFVGSPAEVADLCDLIQIFVADDEALMAVVNQMTRSLTAQHILLVHSTVAPHTLRAAAEIVHRKGAELLDAPFTGSKGAAEKGELVYYIGGEDTTLAQARPVLQASSKEIVAIGKIGDAMTLKVATNMITAVTVQVGAEALALAHHFGITPEKFTQAMASNGSNSGTLGLKLPKMIGGDFEPQFSVKHMLKDVEIATHLARSAGLDLSATSAARHALAVEMKEGRGDNDYASVAHQFFPAGGLLAAKKEDSAEEVSLPGLDLADQSPVRVEAPPAAAAAPVVVKKMVEPQSSQVPPPAPADEPVPAKDEVQPEEMKEEPAEPMSVTNPPAEIPENETSPEVDRDEAIPAETELIEDSAAAEAEKAHAPIEAEPSPEPSTKMEPRRTLLHRLLRRN